MIIDIPTPADFHAAGLKQVHLAWQIAMQSVRDYAEATYDKLADETQEDATAEFWQRSQPLLANSYSLIQQGMELALKGRIATITPYLLIGDPKDWPNSVAHGTASFGDFRTIDATDLVKVHNSVLARPLDDEFKAFFDQVRRDRNRIMHSAAPGTFTPRLVVRTILTAVDVLFNDIPWPRRLVQMEYEGKFASLGFADDAQNNVLFEIDSAIRQLTPGEAKRFFGFDKKRRAYLCPHCYYEANRDWQDDWPLLAQFKTKTPGATALYCFVCEQTTEVERTACLLDTCKGDVIDEGVCLTCTRNQNV